MVHIVFDGCWTPTRCRWAGPSCMCTGWCNSLRRRTDHRSQRPPARVHCSPPSRSERRLKEMCVLKCFKECLQMGHTWWVCCHLQVTGRDGRDGRVKRRRWSPPGSPRSRRPPCCTWPPYGRSCGAWRHRTGSAGSWRFCWWRRPSRSPRSGPSPSSPRRTVWRWLFPQPREEPGSVGGEGNAIRPGLACPLALFKQMI